MGGGILYSEFFIQVLLGSCAPPHERIISCLAIIDTNNTLLLVIKLKSNEEIIDPVILSIVFPNSTNDLEFQSLIQCNWKNK